MARKTFVINADKARNLSFTINTLIEIEEYFSKPIGEVMDSMSELNFKTLRTLFYFGLKWEDKDLTEIQAGEALEEAINNMTMNEVASTLARAMTVSIGASMPPSE